MMKRCIAWLMMLCMVPAAAFAQEDVQAEQDRMYFAGNRMAASVQQDVLAQVQSLLDVTATAVMLTGEHVTPGQELSCDFTMHVGAALCAMELQEPEEGLIWIERYMDEAFAVGHDIARDDVPETDALYGVRVMAMDMHEDGKALRIVGDVWLRQGGALEWTDRRAVAEMRMGAGGWQVSSFAVDADWEMETAVQDYFASAMVEYVNAERGFSIQYPAVFAEQGVQASQEGLRGEMEGAAFHAECIPNTAGENAAAVILRMEKEIPGLQTHMDDITGLVRASWSAQGRIHSLFFTVTPEWIYQAGLAYEEGLKEEFSLYSDYMMNSFTVDEFGLG